MTDKIKVTILPTGTMHADLTWLLIDPGRMASRSRPQKQKDWVEVPTHVVHIEHPSGKKLIWDSGVPRDWEKEGAFSFDGHNLGAHIKSDYDGLTLDTISEDTEDSLYLKELGARRRHAPCRRHRRRGRACAAATASTSRSGATLWTSGRSSSSAIPSTARPVTPSRPTRASSSGSR